MADLPDFVARFEQTRPRLFGIAYRMLGTIEDAEDLVQETFLRWQQADRPSIREPEGWLVSVVTRLSIDRLRRVKTERDAYEGQWLPEPLPSANWGRADERAELSSDLSLAFLAMLERLAPEERAALLLREVFDCGYPEISQVLDKSEAACRQMVHRARERVQRDQPRFAVPAELSERIVTRFLSALHREDREELLALVSPQVSFTSDGGGKVSAIQRVVLGADPVLRLLLGYQAREEGRLVHHLAWINGEAAMVSWYGDRIFFVTAFETDGERITGFYRVLNPDKLRHAAEAASRELPNDA